jgi:hypothetical protein
MQLRPESLNSKVEFVRNKKTAVKKTSLHSLELT